MEFTKDIHFNNILSANKSSKITYSGKLYTDNSHSVHIVYGFGENWEHTTEKEMEKTTNGFSTTVEMKDGFDTFNFCFRNNNYEWDNNSTFNYISPIKPETEKEEIEPETKSSSETETSIETTTSTTIETSSSTETTSSFATSDSYVDYDVKFILEVLDELLQENFSAIKNISNETATDSKQQILEDILAESNESVETVTSVQEFNMDKLVEEILDPVVNFETTITEETPVVENIVEEKIEEVVSPVETIETVEIENKVDFIVETETAEETKVELAAETESSESKDSSTTALTTTPSTEETFLVSPRKLRKFYLLSKKIKIAFYKLFVAIPKLLSGNLWEEKN